MHLDLPANERPGVLKYFIRLTKIYAVINDVGSADQEELARVNSRH